MKLHFLCKFNIQLHLDTYVHFDKQIYVGFFQSLISKTPYFGETLSIYPNYESTKKGNCHCIVGGLEPLGFWEKGILIFL